MRNSCGDFPRWIAIVAVITATIVEEVALAEVV